MEEPKPLQRDNITNYYMLPLLRLNKTSYGGVDNFINSYITKSAEIVVTIRDSSVAGDYWNHSCYSTDYNMEDQTVIVYDIPVEWYDDYLLFMEGKYSYFSPVAKDVIVQWSGLPYERQRRDLPRREDGTYRHTTSERLLALSKHPQLKENLEQRLGVTLDDTAELLSIPHESNYFKLP